MDEAQKKNESAATRKARLPGLGKITTGIVREDMWWALQAKFERLAHEQLPNESRSQVLTAKDWTSSALTALLGFAIMHGDDLQFLLALKKAGEAAHARMLPTDAASAAASVLAELHRIRNQSGDDEEDETHDMAT